MIDYVGKLWVICAGEFGQWNGWKDWLCHLSRASLMSTRIERTAQSSLSKLNGRRESGNNAGANNQGDELPRQFRMSSTISTSEEAFGCHSENCAASGRNRLICGAIDSVRASRAVMV